MAQIVVLCCETEEYFVGMAFGNRIESKARQPEESLDVDAIADESELLSLPTSNRMHRPKNEAAS